MDAATPSRVVQAAVFRVANYRDKSGNWHTYVVGGDKAWPSGLNGISWFEVRPGGEKCVQRGHQDRVTTVVIRVTKQGQLEVFRAVLGITRGRVTFSVDADGELLFR